MAYLIKDDYTLRISQANLDQILTQAAENSGFSVDEIREDAEETAYAEIGAHLTGRYKIEDELAKNSPDVRNKVIMKCAMDIALYNIHFTINPRDIPEMREKAYDKCLENLAAYRDGELLIYPVFPVAGGIEIRPIDEGGDERFYIDGHVKFISKPFSDPLLTDEDATP